MGKEQMGRAKIKVETTPMIKLRCKRAFATLCFLVLALCPFPFTPRAEAQEVVDKMVATVNAGVLPQCRSLCLITYSDL